MGVGTPGLGFQQAPVRGPELSLVRNGHSHPDCFTNWCQSTADDGFLRTLRF